jgi:N-methylhydantoinase B/oxoprolinase/acetone carboxylase alpha subunit
MRIRVASVGGGYGDLRRRAQGAVQRDVRDSVVSPEAARQSYGLEE